MTKTNQSRYVLASIQHPRPSDRPYFILHRDSREAMLTLAGTNPIAHTRALARAASHLIVDGFKIGYNDTYAGIANLSTRPMQRVMNYIPLEIIDFLQKRKLNAGFVLNRSQWNHKTRRELPDLESGIHAMLLEL